MTVNGLNIYYTSKNVGKGLAHISKKRKANGLARVSKKQKLNEVRPIKGSSCKKVGNGLKILK